MEYSQTFNYVSTAFSDPDRQSEFRKQYLPKSSTAGYMLFEGNIYGFQEDERKREGKPTLVLVTLIPYNNHTEQWWRETFNVLPNFDQVH